MKVPPLSVDNDNEAQEKEEQVLAEALASKRKLWLYAACVAKGRILEASSLYVSLEEWEH